jgi:hypothetical protein
MECVVGLRKADIYEEFYTVTIVVKMHYSRYAHIHSL